MFLFPGVRSAATVAFVLAGVDGKRAALLLARGGKSGFFSTRRIFASLRREVLFFYDGDGRKG